MKILPLILTACLMAEKTTAATTSIEADGAASMNGTQWLGGPSFTGWGNGVEYRTAYAFDLSGVTDEITAASFDVYFSITLSTDSTETISIWDSSVSLSSAASPGAFGDLGSGTNYGSLSYSSDTNDDIITITFNSAGLLALNEARGGIFYLGASSTDLRASPEDLWEGSSGGVTETTVQRLVLTTVPEPGSAMLGALALAAIVTRRRR